MHQAAQLSGTDSPLRGGTRSWCGSLHFSDELQSRLRYGCFRPRLRGRRQFNWLSEASPSCWLELTQLHKLGLPSRVLVDAIYCGRSADASMGCLVEDAIIAIALRVLGLQGLRAENSSGCRVL
eukprot:6473071-Amphidinium_carterae.1